jgi:hypothetical protein
VRVTQVVKVVVNFPQMIPGLEAGLFNDDRPQDPIEGRIWNLRKSLYEPRMKISLSLVKVFGRLLWSVRAITKR